ncbi:MAG: MFS transporter [Burkholderiales bacterium]
MSTSNLYEPRRAWTMTVLLALFMLINFIDKVGIGLVAVPMMAELNLSPTEFGFIAGSFFWFFAISGVAGGFVANRYSAKWILMILVIVWSVAQLPIILSSSVAMIMVSRIVLGIGEGPASPIAFHACYKWFPDAKRNLPISVINQGSALGLLIAGVAVPLITARWGWRANFVVMTAIGLVWGIIWLIFGAEGKITSDRAAALDSTGGDLGGRRLPYSRLLKDSTVWGVFAMHFMAFWGLALTLTWLPAYLQKGLGYDAATSGKLFALVVLINAPVNLGLSWWSQRMLSRGATQRAARALLCSFALSLSGALFIALMFLPLQNIQKVILLAVASGLTPVIYSLGAAMMGAVSPDSQRGAMLSIENSIASLAGVFAPVVMGYLIQNSTLSAALGYEQGFAVSGCLLLLSGVVGFIWVNPEKSIQRLAKNGL